MDNEIKEIKRSLARTKATVMLLSCALLIVSLKLIYLEMNFNSVTASLSELVEHLNGLINGGF